MNSEHERLELIRRHIDGIATADDLAALQDALRSDAAFRQTFARYANIDAALGHGRLALAPVASAKTHPPRPKASSWFQWRPLSAAAAGLVIGLFSASMVWAGVTLFRHGAEPVAVALANADFETLGALKVGGFPKEGGYWRGDSCAVVREAGGVHPHSGAGMLQFLHSDGKTDGVGEKLYASDQWQLVDIAKYRPTMHGSDRVVAEIAAWFNSTATQREEREVFNLELYAIRAASVGELNAISSFWLRESNVVVTAGTRRLVVDEDPATWECVAFDLPVPVDAKYLLIHLSALARPSAKAGGLFPGEFADSVTLKLWTQSGDVEHQAER